MLPGSPQPVLSCAGPSARNGLSLACNGSRFHGLHSRVNGPGLLLRSLTTNFAARSTLQLRYRYRFAPVPAASLLLARCSSVCRLHLLLYRPPLPFGVFVPYGSKRSTGFAAGRPAFRIRPIPSRSPLPVLFQVRLRIIVPGSLRFRRLAVPQTSWNLFQYDPESLCRQRPYGLLHTVFNNIYMPLFLIGYRGLAVKVVWIKRGRAVL
jgi:hypothetical protein